MRLGREAIQPTDPRSEGKSSGGPGRGWPSRSDGLLPPQATFSGCKPALRYPDTATSRLKALCDTT